MPSSECEVVRVELGERSYDVVIGAGLLAGAASEIAVRLGERTKAFIVTDDNVGPRHLATLCKPLAAENRLRGSLSLPAGEATKSFEQLQAVVAKLLEAGVERGDCVIALGGGVIGDLSGFAAAILRRGVRYVQIPTSLLAQVDSSVGGKTGINTPHGKNLIGAFHQPHLVLADMDVLQTLPEREMRAGYAEVVKYGLLGDRAFYAWLDDNVDKVLANDARALRYAVKCSVQMKADIVARDETEQGERALLNLGHTFGHALEAWTGYSARLLQRRGRRSRHVPGVPPLRTTRPLSAADGGHGLGSHQAGRSAGRYRRHRRRRAGRCRTPRAPYGTGQESTRRANGVHPGAEHRRCLHHAGYFQAAGLDISQR